MTPWRTRLFLNPLDERIVPDATPLGGDGGTGNNAYVATSGPGVSTGFLSAPGTGNNAYDPAMSGVGNNADTSASGVVSSDFGGIGNNSYGTGTAGIASYDFGSVLRLRQR